MTITLTTGQRTTPNSFRDLEAFTSMTTTTATSEAHGQTLDPDVAVSVLSSGTEVAVANLYQLANGSVQGQEKWIANASATGLSMIALSLATSEHLLTSTATETFTATTALLMGTTDDAVVGLKWINTAWHIRHLAGVTAATASSPFA